jgi:hypothetical protein
MRLPSSVTEPISIGTLFEMSGAASKKDRILMFFPSMQGTNLLEEFRVLRARKLLLAEEG